MKEKFEKDVRSIHNLSDYIPNKLGFSEKEKSGAVLVFWLIYLIERLVNKMVFDIMTSNIGEPERTRAINSVESTFNKLTFGRKLEKIIENCKKEGSYDSLKNVFKVTDELNQIRNQIFHQRKSIKEVCYNGKKIIERETQDQMIIDLGLNWAGWNNNLI